MLFLFYLLPDRLQVTLFEKGPAAPRMQARPGCQEPFFVNPAASSIVAA